MLWWGASFQLLKEVKLVATVQGCAHTMYVVSRCCEVTRCCHPKEKKLDAGMDRRRSRPRSGGLGCACWRCRD